MRLLEIRKLYCTHNDKIYYIFIIIYQIIYFYISALTCTLQDACIHGERITFYNKIYNTFSETIRLQTARFIVLDLARVIEQASVKFRCKPREIVGQAANSSYANTNNGKNSLLLLER